MAVKTQKVIETYKSASLEQGDEVQWSQVIKYLPLLKSIVARMRIYFPESIESEDIYSIALTGLIAAVKNFDPTKGKSFSNYARIRIKG